MLKKKILSLGLSLSILFNIIPINSYATNNVDINDEIEQQATTDEIKQLWIKNYGGSSEDYFNSVTATKDGGYVAVGYTGSNDVDGINYIGGKDAIIVKFDKDGKILWQRIWGGDGNDYFYSVIETTDGGFMVIGETDSANMSGIDYSGYITVKFNSNSEVSWQKNIYGSVERLESIIQINDGGFIGVGYSVKNQCAYIIKLNENGKVLWQEYWDGIGMEYFRSVISTNDNEFIVVGYASTNIEGLNNNGLYDGIVVKFNSNGEVIWQKNWGGSSMDYFNSVTATKDGGFVVVGDTKSTDIAGITNKGDIDGIIVKYNSNGEVLWQKNYGGSSADYFQSVASTNNNEYIVTGNIYSSDLEGITSNGWVESVLVKYDNEGNMVWQKNCGGSGVDEFKSVISTSDSDYIAVGYSGSTNISGVTNKGGYDAIIVKYGILNEPPQIDYTLSPNTWTNGNVTINVTVTDADTGVKEIILPNGNIVKTDNVSYTVSNNGTYYFIAYDNENNQSSVEVKVTKIDKKKPTTNNVHNTEWTNQDVDVIIESLDN